MGIGDIVVLGLLIILIGVAVFILLRNKKDGKCNCGCDSCKDKCEKFEENIE